MEQPNKVERFDLKSIFIYLFIYKSIIEIVYIFCISPLYSYSGLTLNIDISDYWISSFYVFFVVMFSPKDKLRPSSYLFILMEMFLIIPILSYYWMNNQSLIYVSFVVVSSIIISIILKMKPIRINLTDKYAKVWLNFIFFLYILITLYLIVRRGGIDARAFNFDSVYDLRSENELSGILGYLMNWSAKVFCPFFFAFFFYKKRKWVLLSILGLQLLMYLSFGFKAFLFSIGVIIMCVLITKRGKFEREVIIALSSLNIIAYILDYFNITDTLRRAIPYRMLFIPSQIQFQYYEFFKDIEKMHFADGIIGKILSIESPFSEPAPFVISRFFSYNKVASNSNTGLFSDAYSNGGFILMIIVAIMFAFILYVIDSVTYKLPLYVVVGSFSYMMFVLNDTSLQTTLLTGGMGLMIILLLLFNSSIEEKVIVSKEFRSRHLNKLSNINCNT
ncbi:hypothetical protein [Paenibacillus sp. FSL E2-0190]|uniref:hypothetical protein n=1 Tax=Paenibacillus sp. FSL E2-0190 TaxID=2954504 RepID=UPI0030EB6FDE